MKIINWIRKALIAGVIVISFLSFFSVFYKYTGVHITNISGSTDYKWEPGQLMTTVVEGFSYICMDKNGYNNVALPVKNPDILLMGSSHMEAIQVRKNENTGYLLNENLTELSTYNIGISGHNIYTCVKNLNSALAEYIPQKYIIIETNTVELEEKSMQSVLDGTYPRIPSYDSGMMYILQKTVPAVKSIYNQLNEWKNAEREETDGKYILPIAYMDRQYVDSVNKFISKAADSAKGSGVRLIIFYQPPTEIDNLGNWLDVTDPAALSVFKTVCKDNDVIFIDMSDSFEKLYNEKHILAHGFSNSAVGKGHLNKYGHQVIADVLTDVIKDDLSKTLMENDTAQ